MRRIAFVVCMLILCAFVSLYLWQFKIRENTRQLFRDVSLVVLAGGHSTPGGITVDTHPDDDVLAIKEGLQSGIAEVHLEETFFAISYYLVRTSNDAQLVFTRTSAPEQNENVLVETRYWQTVKRPKMDKPIELLRDTHIERGNEPSP